MNQAILRILLIVLEQWCVEDQQEERLLDDDKVL